MNYKDIISCFSESLEKGLTVLFDEYGQKLYGYSVKRFHLNEDEGYDALYKTLEVVAGNVVKYEFLSEMHFENWLFKIHKNNVLQLIRKKSRNELQTVSFDDWVAEAAELQEEIDIREYKEVVDEISSYYDEAKPNPLFSAMQKALEQLNGLEKDILLLRMNNYSYEEIAQMLNIENNQLKVKFSRAKAKLEKKTLQLLKENHNEYR